MKRAEEEGCAKVDDSIVFRPAHGPSSSGYVFRLNWTEDDEEDEEEEDESEKRRWDEMDEDILLVIFQKIDLEDMLLGVPLVCRSWRAASKHPLCWRTLNFRSWERLFRRYFPQGTERIVLDFSKLLRYVVDKTGDNLRSIAFPRRDVTDRTLLYVSQRYVGGSRPSAFVYDLLLYLVSFKFFLLLTNYMELDEGRQNFCGI